MTYTEQAAAFDWRRWDAYSKLWQGGEGVPTHKIAAQFGRPPCEVRRVLQDGARLEHWRPAK